MSYSDDEELKIGDVNIEEDEIDLDLDEDLDLIDDEDLPEDEELAEDEVAGIDGSSEF